MADKKKKLSFDALVKQIMKKGKYKLEQAKAIAAKVGMKKFGKTKFLAMAKAGRKKAARKAKGGKK